MTYNHLQDIIDQLTRNPLDDYPPSPDPGFFRGIFCVFCFIAFVFGVMILFLL